MKARYFYLAMLAASFAFTACSSDDDIDNPYDGVSVPAMPQIGQITCEVDTITVGVDENAAFAITSGGGSYKLLNENDDIATVAVDGNTVTVTGIEKGWAGVIITDANGIYKRVAIHSEYHDLRFDKESLTVGIKLGHTDGSAMLTVTGGNDSYTATVADESVARVSSVSGNVITIGAVGEGTTTVTVTDGLGITRTIPVTVSVSTIPFTDDEKASILERTDNVFNWDTYNSYSWGTWSTPVDNGQQTVYWDYYGYYFMKLYFDGDLSAGQKTGGKLEYKFSWGGSSTTVENVDVEVLKNDGSRVWGIMSLVGTKDDKDYL